MKYSYDHSGNLAVRAVSALLAPQITGQPVKQVAAPGDTVTFSVVVADAREVTFQWKFNGTDIPGATGDSLLLTNVNTANEGTILSRGNEQCGERDERTGRAAAGQRPRRAAG